MIDWIELREQERRRRWRRELLDRMAFEPELQRGKRQEEREREQQSSQERGGRKQA
jgi:hypothetical protein